MRGTKQIRIGACLIFLSVLASAAPGPIHFGAPEVVKLDWSTRAATSADLNGDGLRDIALLNNDSAQIELLLQLAEGAAPRQLKRGAGRNRWDPVLEDSRFESQKITVGHAMFDLAVGDLNRDGLQDLAYTGRDVPLTIRFQDEAGDWIDALEIDDFEALGWVRTIKISDLNGDGHDQLVVVAADAIRVFDSSDQNELEEPDVYYLTGKNPYNLMVSDVTGDGLADLMYTSVDGSLSLALREQLPTGEFGPEARHKLDRPARMVRGIDPAYEAEGQLIAVDARSGILEFLELQKSEDRGGLFSVDEPMPDIYPLFGNRNSGMTPGYALGDLEGDRSEDLIVANPSKSEVIRFEKSDGRFRGMKRFPTFSNVSSLTAGRFFDDPRSDLVVVSGEEKTMGLSRLSEGGRLSFPKQVFGIKEDPVLAEAVDLDRDGLDELALITQSESGQYTLHALRPEETGDAAPDWQVFRQFVLSDVRRAPSGLALLDTFGPELPGLIVYVPREPPVLLAPDEDSEEGFRMYAAGSTIRESLLKGVSAAEVSFFDANADGVKEMVVGRTGFARAYGFEEDALAMVDQYNPRQGSHKIDAVIPHIVSGELRAIVLYVEAESEFQFLRPEEDGVFRHSSTEEVGQIKIMDTRVVIEDDGARSFLFAGEDRFWFFPAQARKSSWQVVDTYETDIEDIQYSHVMAGDFNDDGVAELIALDGSKHVTDLLVLEDDSWRSQLYWQVFEQNMNYQGRKGAKLEPREILIDDFNGDGIADLTFLVHDRLLTYFGE